MRVVGWLAVVLALAAIVVGCDNDDPTPARAATHASTVVPTIPPVAEPSLVTQHEERTAIPEWIAHSSAAASVLLRYTTTGVFPIFPPTDLVGDLLVLYKNGRLLIGSRPTGGGYLWRELLLTEGGIQSVLRTALLDARLLEQPAQTDSTCADCPEFSYHLSTTGRSVEVRLACRGCDSNAGLLRRRLEAFDSYLRGLSEADFDPGEMSYAGYSLPDALKFEAYKVGENDPALRGWPAELGALEPRLVCGSAARVMRDFLDAREPFVNGPDGASYGVYYRVPLPHEVEFATCGLSPDQKTFGE